MIDPWARSAAKILAGVAACWILTRSPVARAVAESGPAPGGVAVVELFTSQGCSSCPPAERVLGELATSAERSGLPVFTLAFHVDYWNQLGWTDPFSSADYSARQQGYGRAFGLDQIYTPQMVVNGRSQFVGSDKAAANQAIRDALAMQSEVTIKVKAERVHDGVRVACSASKSNPGAMLDIAVVEQGLETAVKRGENSGRTLEQPSVVRWFTAQPAKVGFDVTIPLLPEVKAGKATIVVFQQRSVRDPAVLGATAVQMP